VSYPRGTSLLRLNLRTAIARMVLLRARTRRLNGIALDRSRLEGLHPLRCPIPRRGRRLGLLVADVHRLDLRRHLPRGLPQGERMSRALQTATILVLWGIEIATRAYVRLVYRPGVRRETA
jgi:hypothetical protein